MNFKQKLSLLIAITSLFTGNAQVSTVTQKRKPVLIDITGMNCTPCGDLSIWLDNYAANNTNALIIAAHGAANFSDPTSPFDIDMRTEDAYEIKDEIALIHNGALSVVNSFPTVLLNGFSRRELTIPDETIVVENEDSYVNIDLQTTLNEATRELTVQIEMYFTEDAPQEAFLSVGVLQDGLFGYQVAQPGSQTGNFTFNHVLRDVITNSLGNSIGTPTQGQVITETLNYTIPEYINYSSTDIADDPELIIGDLSVFAYIAINEDVIVNGLSRKHHIIETGEFKHLESSASNENIESNQSYNIWPNPSALNEGIKISSESSISNATIIISNVLGQIVIKETGIAMNDNSPVSINTSNLTPGKYIVSIQSETTSIHQSLIIK